MKLLDFLADLICPIIIAAAIIGLLYALFFPTGADARERSVIRDFRKVHACPSTGLHKGACPGFVVDHRIPLCADGPDAVHNLRWQEKAESYRKDKDERALCAWIRIAK